MRIRALVFVWIASLALGANAQTSSGPDSDGDGASDLVENALGTHPEDPGDNPAANGDVVFVVPFEATPEPAQADVDAATKLRALDLYVILDRSGSMAAEITNVRDNLASAVNGLSCPPVGSGDPLTCIPDLWAGAGTVGYSGSGADTFRNVVDLQPNPSFATIPISEPGGCCAEPLTFAVWSAISGLGSAAAAGCGLSGVAPRSSCEGSPASNSGYDTFGYPCFREGVVPLIVLATDEPPLGAGDTNKCPNWSTIVRPQMLIRSARLMGVYGSAPGGSTVTDLQIMATDTGAVDAANGNAPIVVDGAGANATSAIVDGVNALANGVPLDLAALLTDDPSDAIDAVGAFVDHVETLQTGTPECTNGLTEIDTNADTFPDSYSAVRAGTPVCWRIAAKPNTAIAAADEPQVFRARIDIEADATTTLQTRDVYFVVPPTVPEPGYAAQLAASLVALAAIARARR
jgi:hypothetical protein